MLKGPDSFPSADQTLSSQQVLAFTVEVRMTHIQDRTPRDSRAINRGEPFKGHTDPDPVLLWSLP